MILSVSDSTSNGMMMLLLVLCAIVIMIVLLRRHQFRRATGRDLAREQLARIRDQGKLRESMDDLLVQLEEASRRVGAQVETKFAKLETVIRDADERVARLEDVLGRLERLREQPGTVRRCGESASSSAPVAKPPGSPTPDSDASQQSGGASSETRPAENTPADPRLQRVYELVDAGATPVNAAEQLGLPLGEVELILNLRKLGQPPNWS